MIRPTRRDLTDWYRNYAAAQTRRLAVELDLIEAIDPSHEARILDVGCVPPILLAALQAKHSRACGVDIAPERFDTSADGLDLRMTRCDIEKEALPFADGTFDIVLLNEVFEHLRLNIVATMEETMRVIAPGGILLLSTPNARSVRGIVNFLRHDRSGWCGAADIYREYEKLTTLGHMGHVREYTRTDVETLLERLGLNPVCVVWRGLESRRPYRAVTRVFPTLSPLMTLIAQKPAGTQCA